jgi:hypothetical protein
VTVGPRPAVIDEATGAATARPGRGTRLRRWVAVGALLLLVAGGALAYGQVSGTFAIFTAETENQNALAKGSWIPVPSGATSTNPTASPWITEHLAWTSGNSTASPSPNPVTGQTILYASGGSGTSASCPSIGSYTSFKTEAANATTDNLTGSDVDNWWCFAVYSTSASGTTSGSWTSGSVTFTARRIFRATGLSQNDGSGTGTDIVGNTDMIVLTFNQNATLTGTIHVRVCNANDNILIGTNTINNCNATPNIGTLAGQTESANLTCNTSSVSGSGTTTLTITINGCGTFGTSNVGAGTSSFTPASTGEAITSASGSELCTSASAPDCTPSTTSRF